MQNLKDPTSKRTSMGPILAAAFGCLGLVLLGVLVLIVIGGIAYFQGNSLPSFFPSATPMLTNTPIVTQALTTTPTFTASQTFTATQTPTTSPYPTATIIFRPPTLVPTRTRTPVPKPTRTRAPTSTSTPVTTIINDTQYNFKFNTWVGITGKQAIGKGMRCSSTKNELLSFDTVKGVNLLSLFFYRGPNQGKARILVDGVPVETLDLYQVSPQYRYEWKYKIPKPSEAHKVKVIVLREKRYTSVGYQVCFDGYRFDTAVADDINYGIRFGTWSGVLNGKALGGGYRYSQIKDSSVTFTTRGSSFQWITARGPNYGRAAIYVDGKLVKIVDLYFPTQLWQQIISFDNLSRGTHTVSIVVLGQNHPASGGSGMVFDGILMP